MVDRVTDKANKARAGLEKKNSNLLDVLQKYRDQNKLWKDVGLIVALVVLVGLNIKAMQIRGWLPDLS